MSHLIFKIFLLVLCSQTQAARLQFNLLTDKININSALPQVEIYNGKFKIVQGELLESMPMDVSIYCENAKVPFKVVGKQLDLYLFAGYYSQVREFSCYAKDLAGVKKPFLQVKVLDFPYEEEQINVEQGKVILSAENQARAAREQLMLNKIYAPRTEQLLFSEPFQVPLSSERTSIYGNRRIFNKLKKSTHLGNDFRAPVGTPIAACNSGKVIFVGDLFFSGNTVIVDHGMHLYSMYGHLSSFKVKKDDVISRGKIIALSGETGKYKK